MSTDSIDSYLDRYSFGMQGMGCPKWGHEEAHVDEVATTGMGLMGLFDVQNRRFHVVPCENRGYRAVHRGQDGGIVVDLFLCG